MPGVAGLTGSVNVALRLGQVEQQAGLGVDEVLADLALSVRADGQGDLLPRARGGGRDREAAGRRGGPSPGRSRPTWTY